MFSILICIKSKRAFCELSRETFKWGAREAYLQVVHSRRSQSKFTKFRSNKISSVKSDSSQHISTNLKFLMSLWDRCAHEPFLSMNSKLLLFTVKLLFLSVAFLALWLRNQKQNFRNWSNCSFLDDKQRKIVTNVIKGRSDFYSGLTFPSEIRREPKQ